MGSMLGFRLGRRWRSGQLREAVEWLAVELAFALGVAIGVMSRQRERNP